MFVWTLLALPAQLVARHPGALGEFWTLLAHLGHELGGWGGPSCSNFPGKLSSGPFWTLS